MGGTGHQRTHAGIPDGSILGVCPLYRGIPAWYLLPLKHSSRGPKPTWARQVRPLRGSFGWVWLCAE